MKFCVRCGAELLPGTRFCHRCRGEEEEGDSGGAEEEAEAISLGGE